MSCEICGVVEKAELHILFHILFSWHLAMEVWIGRVDPSFM